jgi:phenylacetate-CoA ligase
VLRRATYLAQMLRNERVTPAVLQAAQTRQLSALVSHAALQVPFYRNLYAAHGIRSASFRGVQDLPSLPIVDKRMLRAAGAAAQSLDTPARTTTIRTSGSTGEPYTFKIASRHDQWRKAQYLRPYLSAGRRLGDKVFRLTARPTQRRPWFSRLGLLCEWQFDCTSDPTLLVEAWQRLAPDVLQGYPASLRSLAHHALETGNRLTPAPRLVFSDSALLPPDTRVLVEQAFGTRVIDVFGTFETDNIAFQCAAGDGYHIATDSVVLEIVRDGTPVPTGEEGEIVATVLGNHTSPFIRYNLKDVGRLSTADCPCGLPFPMLAVIEGRSNDLLTLPDGRRCMSAGVLIPLTPFADEIQHYQLRQLAISHFELLIVPSSRFANVGPEPILNAIRPQLGEVTLDLRLVDAIKADRSGKQRAFVSDLAVDHRA